MLFLHSVGMQSLLERRLSDLCDIVSIDEFISRLEAKETTEGQMIALAFRVSSVYVSFI